MSAILVRSLQDNPREKVRPLIDVCVSFAVLETLFVIGFILSWHFNKGNNSSNTKGVCALIMIGYVFCFGGAVIGILKITIGGAGHHAYNLPPDTVRTMRKLVKTHELVYLLSIPFPKLAIIFLYLRIFISKISRILLYTAAFIITATVLFGVITVFSNCRPFNAFWDVTIEARCTLDPMRTIRYYSVPNIVTDVVMLAIPIPALYRLNVSLLAKVGAGFTFFISTLGIITSVLRLVAFLDVDIFSDITYNAISTTNWTIIEPGVYLMAATVPTLRPLFRVLVGKLFPDSFSRYTTCPLQPAMIPSPHMVSTTTITPKTPSTPFSPISAKIERPRLAHKKSSTRDVIETIGRKPSRIMQLDDYHNMQLGCAGLSLHSGDGESMVCVDAVVCENMKRQGRNPDGSLVTWSLGPIEYSPLRASFFLGWDSSGSRL